MIALGFLLFTYLANRHPWRKRLISSEEFLRTLFIGFLAAIIGGRLLFVLLDFPMTLQEFIEIFYIWTGGFSLFGSIIAVLLTVSVYLKKKKVPILQFFDLIALYAPLLQAISRIGCFLAGCCYGEVASSYIFWSVTFTDPHSLAPIGVALHPTQLYSVLASLLIFVFLRRFSDRLSKVPGKIITTYLLLESLSRFLVDFWRWDRGPLYGPLSSMQLIVLSLFVGAAVGLFALRKP